MLNDKTLRLKTITNDVFTIENFQSASLINDGLVAVTLENERGETLSLAAGLGLSTGRPSNGELVTKLIIDATGGSVQLSYFT